MADVTEVTDVTGGADVADVADVGRVRVRALRSVHDGVGPAPRATDADREGAVVTTAERRPAGLDEADPTEAIEGLAERFVAGDRAALETAYHQWSSLVYTIALRALGDHHDAEDVTQQVFVSAWRSRHTLRPADGSLPGWLVGITRHRIADTRTQRWRSVRDTAAVARVASPADAARRDDDVAERLLLAHELQALGEPRGTIVRLAVVEQRPAHEVAATLDLPLGTVKSHVRRGLLQLRARLKEG